jgi:hypothetical protein
MMKEDDYWKSDEWLSIKKRCEDERYRIVRGLSRDWYGDDETADFLAGEISELRTFKRILITLGGVERQWYLSQ